MFSESDLVTWIGNKTSYSTYLSEETSIDNLDLPVPRVYVGHLGIKLENPSQLHWDGYSGQENQEVLFTSIQFICKRSDLVTVRTNIKNAYNTFVVDDPNVSRVSFAEASVIEKNSDRIYWQEIVATIMPRMA